MKKLTLSLMLALVALPGLSQVTNRIKVSALPVATAPTGTELVPIVQGGVTKSTTINQINATVAAATSTGSNWLQVQTTSNTLAIAALNTALPATNAAGRAALGATNDVLLAALIATNAAARSALTLTNLDVRAAMTASNNVLIAALVATNAALNASITAVAQGLGNSLTNGGALTVNSVTSPIFVQTVTNMGTIVATNGQTVFFNGAGPNNALLALQNSQGGLQVKIMPTNLVSGSLYQLWIKNTGPNFLLNPAIVAPGFAVFGTPSTFSVGSSGQAFLNWLVLGTNVICSGSTL